jgi:hypothetical protein
MACRFCRGVRCKHGETPATAVRSASVDRSVNVCLLPRVPLYSRVPLYLGDRKRRAKDDKKAKDLLGARVPGKVDGPIRDC